MAIQWPLVLFSLLTGISAGVMVFIGAGEAKGRFKDVRFVLAVVAFAALVVGGCASTLHLGHPERALHILGNVGSGLSKELFAVGAAAVVLAAYAVTAKKGFNGAARGLGIAALAVGVLVPVIAGASYMMAARPAWDSVMLPLMFLGTGLGTGAALAAALVCAKGTEEDARFAVMLALGAAVVMAASLVAYVAWIALAPFADASRGMERLMSGDLALAFWGGVVVLGIVVPLVCAFLAHKKLVVGVAAADGENAATGEGAEGAQGEQAEKGAAGAKGPRATASALLWAALASGLVGGIAVRCIMFAVGTSVQSLIY